MAHPEIDDINFIESDSVFGRFIGIWGYAQHDIIYTQDDDVLTDVGPIIDSYESGVIVNAMTPEHAAHYRGSQTLIGFGAIFDKLLLTSLYGWDWQDELNRRTCDRIFTALNKHKSIFPRITHMPYATADNRMYRQPQHFRDRVDITKRILERTGINDDPK
jgi:hypothetical protein